MRQYVGIVLIKPDGSVLGQHRDNKPDILGADTWCVIGGAKDHINDKDLKMVAMRELMEEAGYIVPLKDLRFLARDNYTTEKGTPVQRTIFWAWYDGVQQTECHEG
ncbi:NUDIX domain-containing protein, partial [Patescibacteria group bacterium]|nr:NUDIX domain-containing protein [Patescibacteria group bacterium]